MTNLCQDVRMWCNLIMQIRGRPYLYPLHFKGQTSANFLGHLSLTSAFSSFTTSE